MAATWLWSSLLSILILLCPTTTDDACDMKTTRKGRFCPADGALATNDVVNEKTYYECAPCRLIDESAGTCGDCGGELAKKTSPKNACGFCFGETKEAELCVKKHFTCSECDGSASKAGKCEECGADLVEAEVLGVVEYACDGCGHTSLTAGQCGDEGCEHNGKPLTKRCSLAGTPPHAAKS